MATDAPLLTTDRYCVPSKEPDTYKFGWGWFECHMDEAELRQMVLMVEAALVGEVEVEPDFETLWTTYPFRNRRPLHKQPTRLSWDAMTREERTLVIAAVKNYAKDKDAQLGIGVKDCFRWLGFTYHRSTKKVKRIAGEPPWREWVDATQPEPEKPKSGPYATYQMPPDCEYCGGCGIVTIHHPNAKRPGQTTCVGCCCDLGRDKLPSQPKFDKGRMRVA